MKTRKEYEFLGLDEKYAKLSEQYPILEVTVKLKDNDDFFNKWVTVKDIKKELVELVNLIPNTLTISDQRLLDKINKIKDDLK
jgi:enolase